MPTNLPPEYFDADKRYRAAKTPQEKITTLEALISTIPKHKGTDKLRADLRKKLSKLKSSAEARKGTGRHVSAYNIEKEGAGQVVVIGPANTGKSALVAALTNASPEVAEFPFSTWGPTPGMMLYEDIQIQLIDTPPINRDFIEPEFLELIRRSDLILLVIDLQADTFQQMEESIHFLNKSRVIPAPMSEGVQLSHLLSIIPLLVVVNKTDDEMAEQDFEVLCELMEHECPLHPVSVKTGRFMNEFKQAIFDQLDIIRVFSKPPGEDPDYNAPHVLEKGATVEEFAGKIHHDFIFNLKSARVWGNVEFEGQMVSRDHVLADGDVVELRT